MSYEDSFEREAKDERLYMEFERAYLFKNCKPDDIGEWAWYFMFHLWLSYEDYAEASRAARAIARERNVAVDVSRSPSSYVWHVIPQDMYKRPEGSRFTTYETMRNQFVRQLVVEDRFPDLSEASRTEASPEVHYAVSHYWICEVIKDHIQWKIDAGLPPVPYEVQMISYRKI